MACFYGRPGFSCAFCRVGTTDMAADQTDDGSVIETPRELLEMISMVTGYSVDVLMAAPKQRLADGGIRIMVPSPTNIVGSKDFDAAFLADFADAASTGTEEEDVDSLSAERLVSA